MRKNNSVVYFVVLLALFALVVCRGDAPEPEPILADYLTLSVVDESGELIAKHEFVFTGGGRNDTIEIVAPTVVEFDTLKLPLVDSRHLLGLGEVGVTTLRLIGFEIDYIDGEPILEFSPDNGFEGIQAELEAYWSDPNAELIFAFYAPEIRNGEILECQLSVNNQSFGLHTAFIKHYWVSGVTPVASGDRITFNFRSNRPSGGRITKLITTVYRGEH